MQLDHLKKIKKDKEQTHNKYKNVIKQKQKKSLRTSKTKEC